MKDVIRIAAIALGVIFFSTICAFAQDLSVPHTFNSGEAAVAQEVNDNFSAVVGGINTNTSNISANTAAVAGMPGVDFLEADPPDLSTTPIILMQQTITAPTSGYVHAVFSSIAYFYRHQTGTSTNIRVWMNLDGDLTPDITDPLSESFRYFSVPYVIPTGTYYFNVHSAGTIPVSAGTTTFYVVGDSSDDTPAGEYPDTSCYNSSLHLLFFPERY